MIRTEKVTVGGREYVRTYSDAGYRIARDGMIYDEAVDPAGLGRTYTETDAPIESYMTEAEEKAKAYDIITGVSE